MINNSDFITQIKCQSLYLIISCMLPRSVSSNFLMSKANYNGEIKDLKFKLWS